MATTVHTTHVPQARRSPAVAVLRRVSQLPPFAREIAIAIAAYLVYEAARVVAAGSYPTALAHAHDVVALERYVHLDFEGGVQRAFLDSPLLPLLNYVYLAAQNVVPQRHPALPAGADALDQRQSPWVALERCPDSRIEQARAPDRARTEALANLVGRGLGALAPVVAWREQRQLVLLGQPARGDPQQAQHLALDLAFGERNCGAPDEVGRVGRLG